jgi:DNA-binding ferritin-like protein
MAETDPEELADQLEKEADELAQRSEKLGEQTDDVAQDWQRKRSDPNVPGAQPPAEDEGGAPPTGAPTGKDDEG